MRLLRSFRHAFAGAAYLLRTQPNARIHLVVAIGVIAVSAWLGLAAIEWAIIILCVASVWAAEAFNDLDVDVRQSIARIHAEPSIPLKDSVRGFVYDVATGALREVL